MEIFMERMATVGGFQKGFLCTPLRAYHPIRRGNRSNRGSKINHLTFLGNFFFLLCLLILCSCTNKIENTPLRDRTLACSAALSTDLYVSLQGHRGPLLETAKISGDFKEHLENIFSFLPQLPQRDRLKLYEDYIKCIETLKNPGLDSAVEKPH